MRIAFFTTDFPYLPPFENQDLKMNSDLWGGVAIVTYNLCLELQNLGHEVIVFTTSFIGKNEIQKSGRITVFRYRPSVKIESTPISAGLILRPLIDGTDIDIVHIQQGSPPGALSGYLFAKMKNIPFVVTFHGEPEIGYGGSLKRMLMTIFNGLMGRRIFSGASVINTLSKESFNQSDFLRGHDSKNRIIPNGVRISDFEIAQSKAECRARMGLQKDSKIVLFVGSLTRRKGPHILLQSMKKVLEEIPDSQLIIIGDGILRQQLEKDAVDLGIAERVRITGFIPESEKVCYYHAADLFTLPSFSEAFPIAVLEASASGLPLVVSDLPCFRAIINDGSNGLFSKVGDPIDLSERIIHLLCNETLRGEMAINAKSRMADFSWSSIGKETETIYGKIIAGQIR
jgi:glycosyltransferase involved in cell wall biosynthesis